MLAVGPDVGYEPGAPESATDPNGGGAAGLSRRPRCQLARPRSARPARRLGYPIVTALGSWSVPLSCADVAPSQRKPLSLIGNVSFEFSRSEEHTSELQSRQ